MWYAELIKAPLTPPDAVFGPVWTLLYIMMAIAAFLVWQKGFTKNAVRVALVAFAIQLALNLLWSGLFFGLQQPLLALGNIILLWLAIVWTIVLFHPISKPAAWLLAPYLAWVSFATYLNAAIWWLNR